jgi:SAM-dependent methyltransferase
MKKQVEIISLIYKSTQYLNFIYDQLKNNCKSNLYDIHVRIVANDASDEVLEHLKKLDIKYTIYNAANPSEYYLNRVYKAYNFAVQTSDFENIILVNSDNMFSDGWIDNLMKHHDGANIPCTLLIESGKMPSGKYGISKNFGTHPNNLKYDKWKEYSSKLIEQNKHVIKPGGLYGAVLFNRDRFIVAKGYPEGNVYSYGFGYDASKGPVGYEFIKSSDDYFFHDILEKEYGMKHITVFDSVLYHIQTGEKDE